MEATEWVVIIKHQKVYKIVSSMIARQGKWRRAYDLLAYLSDFLDLAATLTD